MIKTGKRKLLKKEKARDFADGPVVKTLCSWCRGQGQGTRSLMLQLKKIPHAAANTKTYIVPALNKLSLNKLVL